jgi:transposase
LRAFELKQEGWPQQRDIADALGVSKGAVSQWMKRGREGGVQALKRQPAPGAPPRLSEEQRAEVPKLLERAEPRCTAFGEMFGRARG